MTTALYVQAAEELRGNAEQWNAYESSGNCVILAGPGSGKTKTITIKIARLLAEGVRPPRRLASITYSNACVGELRTRLQKLDIEYCDRLLLSTVHSFCLIELVLPYARLAGIDVPEPLLVASPSQSREFFREAHVQVLGSPPPTWFRVECDKLRRTILDRDGLEWQTWTQRETKVVESYESLLSSNGFMDFDGLVLAGLELLEKHEWVRRSICAKYPVVVIDEYQDLGLALHRMVLTLMKDAGVRVIAVGDPDQSIYGFTGANPTLLRTLAARHDVLSIRLKLNYRCANHIIAASKSLLPNPAEFESHDGREGQIHIYQLKCDVRGQADYALGTIVPELLKNNPTWKVGDIAVLYRTLNQGTPIAEAADALGMQYFRVDNGSPIRRSRLTDWLTAAAKWCSGGWQSGTVNITPLLKSWRLMRQSLTREADVLAARAKLISTLLVYRDGSMALRKWLIALRDEVFEDAFRIEPGLADERDNFGDLLEGTDKGGPLESYTVEIFGHQGKSPDQINLMTLHSSKGLEFQAVIMVGLEAGEFPNNFEQSGERLEEVTRLFYVGVTRAKELVYLLYGFKESPLITTVREATESVAK